MIVVKMYGGLGNQMFQYAAARSLSMHLNQPLCLNTSAFDRKFSFFETKRKFELDIFAIGYQCDVSIENSYLKLRFGNIFAPNKKYQVLKEQVLNVPCDIFSYSGDIVLDGYWQDIRYFESISNQIYKDFQFVRTMSGLSFDFQREIENSKEHTVAIHVRRGDYVNSRKANAFHGLVNVGYYKESLDLLRKMYGALSVFVFSDDLSWCRKELNIDDFGEIHYVDCNFGQNSWQDLALIARCKSVVCANSSFSWWGAWLSRMRFLSESYLSVIPNRWFVDESYSSKSMRNLQNWVAL